MRDANSEPLILDLYCRAGGCSVGYKRAGFRVVGNDIEPQRNYPFPFVEGCAIKLLECLLQGGYFKPTPEGPSIYLEDLAAIHASPPCQRYTRASFRPENRAKHPDLLAPTRSLLEKTGKPWVIENVPGAPVQDHPIELCGLMFGLKVFRHRWFESSVFLMTPPHPSHRGKRIGVNGMCCVIGHGGGPNYRTRLRGEADNKKAWQTAMGIDWMTRDEMSQAIPPAYTEFIGRQLIQQCGKIHRT